MPPQTVRLRVGCHGKQRFNTPALAVAVAGRRTLHYRTQETYHCPHCGGWHIAPAKS